MRWLGGAARAHEIAVRYATSRSAFGKLLVDHEGVGFMLADNLIDLKQAELMIDWCAGVLDAGSAGTAESSMAKVAVSDLLFRIADRCVQVMAPAAFRAIQWLSRFFGRHAPSGSTTVRPRPTSGRLQRKSSGMRSRGGQ